MKVPLTLHFGVSFSLIRARYSRCADCQRESQAASFLPFGTAFILSGAGNAEQSSVCARKLLESMGIRLQVIEGGLLQVDLAAEDSTVLA